MLVAHQKPTDLVLAILCTDAQLPLTVLDQSTLHHAQFSFTFQIIGESHAVRISHHETLILQEILACVAINPKLTTHHHPFGDLAPHEHTISNYHTAIAFTTHPIPLLSNPSLEVRFPAIHNQQPITQIAWEISENSIRWKTLHLYPSEHHIISVKSVSSYQLA